MKQHRWHQHLAAFLLATCCPTARAPAGDGDLLIADFEGETYGAWEATGTAFGTGPARGTLPGQQPVSGYLGKRLVNSYLGGDAPTGSLTSGEVKIERRYVNFLVGGGDHAGGTCVNLLVDGAVVRSATGNARTGADDEHLSWRTWDVGDLLGKRARIEIADRESGSWGHINADHFVESERRQAPDHPNEAIARAQASVEGAAARAAADPARPRFHFLPPALWQNDPNGPLFFGGWYHLFYQQNPYGDRWERMHWGHARSKDLVRWEHLPIALWPTIEAGEEHCFSGCAALDGKEKPILLYTSIALGKGAGTHAEQWGALPEDGDLIRWRKHPQNPLLTEKIHGKTKMYDWRDPFIFRHEGRSYMVCGSNLNGAKGGEAVVNLYRADDADLTSWTYLGVLFRHPDPKVANIECPNFFRLGDRWLLIVSPYRSVEWFTGDVEIDAATGAWTFKARRQGIMDRGNYYAPNCLEDPAGRRVLWGWVNNFPGKKGWNGCMTLPRILTLDARGDLGQAPATELETLRSTHAALRGIELDDASRSLPGEIRGEALEVLCEVEPAGAKECGVRFRRPGGDPGTLSIRWDGRVLDVEGQKAPLERREGENAVRLHLFLDRSVLEVYAGGRECVTRVVAWEPGERVVEVFAAGGRARFSAVDAWTLKPIW